MTRVAQRSAAYAAARLAFGALLMAAPGRLGRGWLGADARRPSVQVALRAIGVRDAVVATGLLAACRRESDVRPLLGACVACDLVDMAATLAAGPAVPRRARAATVAVAGPSALVGAALTRAAYR